MKADKICADARAMAEQIVRDAQAHADELRRHADKTLSDARATAEGEGLRADRVRRHALSDVERLDL